MKRFVPREKLGKKARKQHDSEQRATWAFHRRFIWFLAFFT